MTIAPQGQRSRFIIRTPVCILVLAMLVLSGCSLPAKDGSKEDPRNALMHTLNAWTKGDGEAVKSGLCTVDQDLIERIETARKRVLEIGPPEQQKNKLNTLSAPKLALDALGDAPDPSQNEFRVRLALMRAEVSEKKSGLSLAGWRLQKNGADYAVCLNKTARTNLLDIEKNVLELEKKLKEHDAGKTLRVF